MADDKKIWAAPMPEADLTLVWKRLAEKHERQQRENKASWDGPQEDVG